MITALCGGVGGSKLVLGLYQILGEGELSVIVNTADDVQLWGLHISPDVDTVTYTLAGLSQRVAGWGIQGDTFQALTMMHRYGGPSWFQVGDQDLATHVYRSQALRSGWTLTEVTDHVRHALGVHAHVLPMTEAPVATRLRAGGAWLEFQEYFVRDQHRVYVDGLEYAGIDGARPTTQVAEAICDAEAIILVNSNPVLSIMPILSVPGIRAMLADTQSPKVAVTPLVGDDAVSGPAAELMGLIGCPPTVAGLAQAYEGVIDGLVIDRQDEAMRPAIEQRGIRVISVDTIMRDEEDRKRVAGMTLAFARALA